MAYVSKINIDGVNYDILAAYVGASDMTTSSGQLLSVSSGKVSKSTATIGSGTNPVYLSSGVITKSGSTVGSTSTPVYLNSGVLTTATSVQASKLGSSTVGSSTNPIYLSSGTATASSSSVGSGTNPIYLSSGTITKSSSTVGSTSTPVYLNSGTLAEATNVKPKYTQLYSGSLSVGSSTTISSINNYIGIIVTVAGLGLAIFGMSTSYSAGDSYEFHCHGTYVSGSLKGSGQIHICIDLTVSGTKVTYNDCTMVGFSGPTYGSSSKSYSSYVAWTPTDRQITTIYGVF